MPNRIGGRVSRMARFQQTLRRLAMGDKAFVQDEAELGLDRAGTSAPHSRTAALLRLGERWLSGRWWPAWNGAVRTLAGCVTSGTGILRSADGI